MAQDRVLPEHAEVAQPRDGRLAVTTEHLVELHDRLRSVDLPRPLALVGRALGGLQQLRRAGVDLGRREEAADPIAVGAVPALVQLDGVGEPAPSLLLVPLPLDAPPVAGQPAARAEGEADVDAQPEVAGTGGDVLAGAADLHHRGHAAPQQLGHREVDTGVRRLVVLRGAAHRQELEEPGVEELWVAAVFDE